MSNTLTSKELIKEAKELFKVLRRIIIIYLVSTLLMLIPLSGSSSTPLCVCLLNLMLRVGLISLPEGVKLIMGNPVAPVRVMLASSAFFGLIFGSPPALIIFYRYLRPALYPHERHLAFKYTLVTAVLLYAGIIYGIFIIAPLTIKIMISLGYITGVEPVLLISDYYEFIVISVIATAISFLIPIPIYLLRRIFGIDLRIRKYWRYIFVIGYTITAIITPDPTPITAILILAPPLSLSIAAEIIAEKGAK